MKIEKEFKPKNGYSAFFILLLLIGLSLFMIIALRFIPAALLLVLFLSCFAGLMTVNPNESSVLVLFGKYMGTVKENGFFWTNPFYIKKKISLRARNFNNEPIKVNDKLETP